ncbi:MAG: AAA family ATPase [Cyanobacteria bacterium]|jgi:chromosome partitioning protein|nr:AAA family ATPase [Cyanobacteria bacterium GSL.Bin21]
MNKIISIFNQSGGVGKTTLTLNLGYHLSEKNQKVLLIDLDPQGSLTSFMGIDNTKIERTLAPSLLEEEAILTLKDIHQMDLVPSNIFLSNAELQLVNIDYREARLKEALSPIQNNYDFILIDCPPSLSLLTMLALTASTEVLIPIQTQFKAFLGTSLLINTIQRVKKRGNQQLQLNGFIPTLYDRRNSQDTRCLNTIKEKYQTYGKIYPFIPRTTGLADASEDQLPLALYDPKNKALQAFRLIVQELI